jgi:HEAT repeat protein
MAKGGAKTDALDERLAALHALRTVAVSDDVKRQLIHALADKQNLVVARAADVVAAQRIAHLAPQLAAAFARLMRGGDKGCVGKAAVVKALEAVEANQPDTFKQGVRHVQLEPTWGGQSDVAVDLRATCALALSRLNRPDVLIDLTDLLADREAAARLAAARAIGHCGREEGSLPLRLKIRLGREDEPNVTAECFDALLKLSPAKNLDFVAEFLDAKDTDLRDTAALALGESRQPAAFDRLLARYERKLTAEPKRILLLALAQTRHPRSLEIVLPIITERNTTIGAWAIESLALYRGDDAVRSRIAAGVADRDDPAIRAAFEAAFGTTCGGC